MNLEKLVGKTFGVKRLNETPCLDCNSCLRLSLCKLSEQEINFLKIVEKSHGLWKLQLMSSLDGPSKVLAFRDEELDSLMMETSCPIKLI
jgi:hypothetical protein